MAKLRMAVVGMGMGGSYGARIHKSPAAEFAAMCDLDAGRLKTRAELYKKEIGAEPKPYTSVDEMLAKEKLDGVVISTPSATHHTVAVKVAGAGVNLLIDKPIDISAENIDKIESAVKKTGVLCGVNYPLRLSPLMNGAKKAITDGLLGKILLCDVRMKWHRGQAYYDKGGWRGTWAMDGGGSLMNQGAHYMDLLCWFLGKPVSVTGEFAALNHKIETEDWASGTVAFEGGARSTISTTTCVLPQIDTNWVEVHGTTGSIYMKAGGSEEIASGVENLRTLAVPKFDYPVEEFIDAVAHKRPPLVSIEEARRSVNLINGIYRSAREGRRVAL
ncbi:MAG: Gfo/Idh/MocA family oxidoreductase [Planctomycetota bacterium]